MNEDKIKVLKKAIKFLKRTTVQTGVCDALNFSCGDLPSSPHFYGIRLPERKYGFLGYFVFSFPLTAAGKLQRIELLKRAIKKLQS